MTKNTMTRNAVEMLKEDHDRVRGLLDKLSDTTARGEKTRTELLERIAKELRIHTTLEEELFYPAFREAGEGKVDELYFEAMEEHRAVDELVLPDLEQTEAASERFSGRAKVLKELVEHHAEEEEEELFPKAEELLSIEELEALGARMAERKQELQ